MEKVSIVVPLFNEKESIEPLCSAIQSAMESTPYPFEMILVNDGSQDGSWAEMDSQPAHHDATQHDPERDWGRWRIFRCRTCEEVLTVHQGEVDVPGSGAGK